MSKPIINYKEFISEINEEVTEGIISQNDTIQILRDSKPVFDTYCPIIEWYYEDYVMNEEINTPLEEIYLPEEFTEEEWIQMQAEQAEMKKQYEEDKDKLIQIKVKDVLTEMKQMQKLIG